MSKTVADWCLARQISLDQLAQGCSLDPQRVTAIALGRWTPSPEERQEIATVLGVSVGDVAWGHVTPVQHLYGHGPG